MHIGAIAALLALLGPAAERSGLSVSVAPSLVKVRPDQPLPPEAKTGPMQLEAARGECEAAQLVATAAGTGVERLEVRAAPPVRAGGGRLDVVLYRQAFLQVKTPSAAGSTPGPWPDALVPAVDAEAGEPRRAFPVAVGAGRHQPVWVETCVPASAQPGRYEGALSVLVEGRERTRVPLVVEVRRALVPATSTLPVTMGLSGRSALLGHYGEVRDDAERLALVRRYARAALRHRISLHAMTLRAPTVTWQQGKPSFDFTGWEQEIAPFMDGTALPGGARFSAIDLRTPPGLDGEALRSYYRAVEQRFRERGWLDRLFAYVMDEPKSGQFDELRRRLQALQAAPGIRRLVTMPLEKDFAGLVDIWTPNLNCVAWKDKPREFCARFAPRADYGAREKSGDRVWWYQSCSSHGCNHGPFGDERDRYFAGWPSYVVDADGASARVMGWLAYANDIGGELYFDTLYSYNFWSKDSSPRRDPWDDQWHHGGNGDGTLFYPGRPQQIGGTTHVPVESLRLKHVRDGLEDYELLRQLEARGEDGRRQARQIAARIAPAVHRFEHAADAWARARRQLLDALDSAETPGSATAGNGVRGASAPVGR